MSSSQHNGFDATLTTSSGTVTIGRPGKTYMVGDIVTAYSTTTPDAFQVTVTGVDGNGGISSQSSTGIGTLTFRVTAGSANATTTRNASDATRLNKETELYNEFKTNSTILNSTKSMRTGGIDPINSGASGTLWLQQSNQLRLSYLSGKQKCTYCPNGLLNANGIRNFSSAGVQQGS